MNVNKWKKINKKVFSLTFMLLILFSLIPISMNAKQEKSDKNNTSVSQKENKKNNYKKIQEKNTKAIVVHYINQNGNQILNDETISGNAGDDYEVQTKDLTWKGYDFRKLDDGSAPLIGKITEDTQNVILVYQGRDAYLKVIYKAQGNIQLIDPIILEGKVGDAYQTEQKDFTDRGFDFKDVEGEDPEGNFSYVENPTPDTYHEVHYIYTGQYREEAVRVKFVDQNGNLIMDDQFIEGYVGSGYDLPTDMIPVLDGYTYQKASDDSAPFAGIVTPDQQTITLIYQGNPNESAVIVHYVNQNGDKVADDETLTGIVGDAYTAEQKDLSTAGYTYDKLAEGSAPESGTVTVGTQEVTFIYQGQQNKNAVKVHYVDENGNKIANDKNISGRLGDEYNESPIKIKGYTYDKLANDSAAAKGIMTLQTQEITFVYKVANNDDNSDTDNNGKKDNNSNNKNDNKNLPDTGDQTTFSLILMGICLIGLVGFIFRKFQK